MQQIAVGHEDITMLTGALIETVCSGRGDTCDAETGARELTSDCLRIEHCSETARLKNVSTPDTPPLFVGFC